MVIELFIIGLVLVFCVSIVVGFIHGRKQQKTMSVTDERGEKWQSLSEYEREQIERIADSPDEIREEIDDWS